MGKAWLSVGHGYEKAKGVWDYGAAAQHTIKGKAEYVREYDECKKVVDRAIEILEAQGVEVGRIPLGLSVASRIQWVNNRIKDDDMVLEVHTNAASAAATGAEIFYEYNKPYEQKHAEVCIKAYTKTTGLYNRGAKPDTMTQHGAAGLGMVRRIRPLGLLVELGFITNASDLETVRLKAGLGVANMLLAYKNLPQLTGYHDKAETQKVSKFAEKAQSKSLAKKSTAKGAEGKSIIEDWSRPQDIATPDWWAHVLHKLGGLESPEGPLTKERAATALERLKQFD